MKTYGRIVIRFGYVIFILVSYFSVSGESTLLDNAISQVRAKGDLREIGSDTGIWRLARSTKDEPKMSLREQIAAVNRVYDSLAETRNKRTVEYYGQPRNMLNGIDLSDPEYLPDHHHGTRRVKKVLDSDDPLEISNRYNYGNPDRAPRMKRWVLPFNLSPLLALGYLLSGGQINSENIKANPSSIQEIPVKPRDAQGNGIVKTGLAQSQESSSNLTAVELKYFHQVLITAVSAFCPKVRIENANMIQNVQRFVAAKIRAARTQSTSTRTASARNNEKFWTLIGKINKCAESEAESEKMTKSQRRTRSFPSDKLEAYFDEQSQRLRRMSQKDVVPNSLNMNALDALILQMVYRRCKNLDEVDQTEVWIIGSQLLAITRQETSSGIKPTIHQNEMVELVDTIRNCFQGNSPSFMDALEDFN